MAFLRLLRLMRLFKLVSKVKQLQVIVSGLIKGLGSVTYILILMLLIMYLFAVLGCVTFRYFSCCSYLFPQFGAQSNPYSRNDPFHFGSIGVSMVRRSSIYNFNNDFNSISIGYSVQNDHIRSVVQHYAH